MSGSQGDVWFPGPLPQSGPGNKKEDNFERGDALCLKTLGLIGICQNGSFVHQGVSAVHEVGQALQENFCFPIHRLRTDLKILKRTTFERVEALGRVLRLLAYLV